MSEPVVVSLAVLGPSLVGVALAFLVRFLPHARQSLTERLLGLVALVSAVALDFHGEGPEHGFFLFVLLTLPGILSFVVTRFVLVRLARRSA